MKSNIKYVIYSTLIVVAVILVGFGITYSYFQFAYDGTTTESKIQTSTFDIETSLTNTSGINASNLSLIEESEIESDSVGISFDIKSKARGNNAGKFNVYLKDIAISNGMKDSYFRWQLVMDGTVIETGDFSDIDTKGVADINKTNTETISYYSSYYLKEAIDFNGSNKSDLIVRVYMLNDPLNDQSNLLNGTFETRVAVEAYNSVN